MEEFNAACRVAQDEPERFKPAILDGVRTDGVSRPSPTGPCPIDQPPFEAYVTTTGVTFTFGGLRVDERCAVQDLSDRPIPGLYAAGELVGGLFYENCPGGNGLMAGTVFGKLAGESAAAESWRNA